ncbi:MAG: NAD(P)-dependent oxidoreductase, partial [Bacilli bacterium]|nr:NAD(P)-dependent oxidoreductase [Bacilli bacterium]
TKSLLYRNQSFHSNIKIVLTVRNRKKAEEMFGIQDEIEYLETSIEELSKLPSNIDYVIHCASPTKSKFFISNPVETMNTSIIGTQKLLELCKGISLKKFIFLSSMEMYGVLDSKNVTEKDLGYLNNLDARSSYSIGKRVSELYSYCYFKEYNVPIVIARLAMCFGAGVFKEETRVYKYFCDCVLNKQDIEIKSTGKTIVNFVYTLDAVKALFILLNKGVTGEAYNVSADSSNFTILDMANYLAERHGEGTKVVQNIPKENQGFAPDNTMVLNNEKLKSLGWKSDYLIEEALSRTLEYLKNE